MATHQNLSRRSNPRAAAIVRRLRSYRSQPQSSNVIRFPAPASVSLEEFMASLDLRGYVDLRFLQFAHRLGFEPGPDDDAESGPDRCGVR